MFAQQNIEGHDPGIEEMLKAAVQRIAEKSGDKDTSLFHLKVLKLVDAIQLITQKDDLDVKVPETVMPYKQAKDIVLNNPDSIALGECICRATSENPCLEKNEREVCMYIGDLHASFLAEHNDKYRKITQEEAVDVLKFAHEKGFVHCAEFKAEMGHKFVAICNCCKCCCLGVQMWNVLGGTVPVLSPSGYLAHTNENCTGCGICAEECHFLAVEINEENVAVVNSEKCMGCGICEDTCPEDAIALKRDPSKGDPLDLKELIGQQ